MERFGTSTELALEFPCTFPIKVVGRADAAFHAQVCAIASRHDPVFDPETHVQVRASAAGTYQSLTIQLRATSKEQIDAVYQDLKSCELVLWAL